MAGSPVQHGAALSTALSTLSYLFFPACSCMSFMLAGVLSALSLIAPARYEDDLEGLLADLLG